MENKNATFNTYSQSDFKNGVDTRVKIVMQYTSFSILEDAARSGLLLLAVMIIDK